MIEPHEMETAEKRAGFVEHEELDIINKSKEQKASIESDFNSFSADLKKIRHKIRYMNEELAELNKKFQEAVKLLRETASKSDLDVVERKVTMWSPEKLVTKRELKNILKDS